MQRKSFLAAGAAALLSGCGHHERASAQFEDIASDGEPLKSAFNRDAGKVRIMMLVSPT